MNIRIAKREDTPALEQLFYLTRKQTFSTRPKGSFQIGDYQESTSQDKVWVADINGTIVGFVSIYSADKFIHNLFVHPKFQGQGIGWRLLQIAEENLLRPITLKIAMDNLRVCGFYEKHGYHQVSIHRHEKEPYMLYRKD